MINSAIGCAICQSAFAARMGGVPREAVAVSSARASVKRYHRAGLIFSTLGLILILFMCYKLKIHFSKVDPF